MPFSGLEAEAEINIPDGGKDDVRWDVNFGMDILCKLKHYVYEQCPSNKAKLLVGLCYLCFFKTDMGDVIYSFIYVHTTFLLVSS